MRARMRLRRAKRRREDPDEDEEAERKEALAAAHTVVNQSSELADERPIVGCAFRPDGRQLATAAWSGLLKLWTLPHCERALTIRAHQDRVTGARGMSQGLGEEPCLTWISAVDRRGPKHGVGCCSGNCPLYCRLPGGPCDGFCAVVLLSVVCSQPTGACSY